MTMLPSLFSFSQISAVFLILSILFFDSALLVASAASHKMTFALPTGSRGMKGTALVLDPRRKKVYIGTETAIYTVQLWNATCQYPCLATSFDAIMPLKTSTLSNFTNALWVEGTTKAGFAQKVFWVGATASAAGRILVTDPSVSPMTIDDEYVNSTMAQQQIYYRALVSYKLALFALTTSSSSSSGAPSGTDIHIFKSALESFLSFSSPANIDVLHEPNMLNVQGGVVAPPLKGESESYYSPIAYFWSDVGIYKYDMSSLRVIGGLVKVTTTSALAGGFVISPLYTVAAGIPFKDSGGQIDEYIWAAGAADGLVVRRYKNADETSSSAGNPTTLEPLPIDENSVNTFQMHKGTVAHTIVDSKHNGGNVWLLDRDVMLHEFSTTAHTVPSPGGTTQGSRASGEANYRALVLSSPLISGGEHFAVVVCDTDPVRLALFTGTGGENSGASQSGGGSSIDTGTIIAIVVVVILGLVCLGCVAWILMTRDLEDTQNRKFEVRGDADVIAAAARAREEDEGNGDARVSHSIRRLDASNVSAVAGGRGGGVMFTDLRHASFGVHEQQRNSPRHATFFDYGNEDEEMQPPPQPFSPPPM